MSADESQRPCKLAKILLMSSRGNCCKCSANRKKGELQATQSSKRRLAMVWSVLRESLEDLEVIREGLPRAAGVFDGDGDVCAGGEGEGHRHAVIVVGVDRRHVQSLRRGDDAVIRPLLHRRSQLKTAPKKKKIRILKSSSRTTSESSSSEQEEISRSSSRVPF